MCPTTSCLRGDEITTRSCHHHHGAAIVAMQPPACRHHHRATSVATRPPTRRRHHGAVVASTAPPAPTRPPPSRHASMPLTGCCTTAQISPMQRASLRARWATHGGCCNSRPVAVCEADFREKTPAGNCFGMWHVFLGARFWRFCNSLHASPLPRSVTPCATFERRPATWARRAPTLATRCRRVTPPPHAMHHHPTRRPYRVL